MAEWAWTIEGIRRMVVAHVSNIHAWEHDGIAHGNPERAETAERFNAAMAAHDAEVRAKALDDLADDAENYLRGTDVSGQWLMAPISIARVRDRARAERGEL